VMMMTTIGVLSILADLYLFVPQPVSEFRVKFEEDVPDVVYNLGR